jgi:hypothetical protein
MLVDLGSLPNQPQKDLIVNDHQPFIVIGLHQLSKCLQHAYFGVGRIMLQESVDLE